MTPPCHENDPRVISDSERRHGPRRAVIGRRRDDASMSTPEFLELVRALREALAAERDDRRRQLEILEARLEALDARQRALTGRVLAFAGALAVIVSVVGALAAPLAVDLLRALLTP